MGIQTKETEKTPVYTVSFEWREYYEKGNGINSISLNVRAETNFKALGIALNMLAALNLPEPTKFNATKK